MFKRGNVTTSKAYLGSTQINKVLLGATDVFTSGPAIGTDGPLQAELDAIPGLVALWDATALTPGDLSGASTIPNLINAGEPLTFGTDVFDRADETFDGRTYVVLKAGSGYTGASLGRMRCASWFGSGTRQTGQYAFILVAAGSASTSTISMGCADSSRRQLVSAVVKTYLYNNNFASGSAQVESGVFRRQNRLFEPTLIAACNYDNASSQIVENVDTFPEHDLGGEGNFMSYAPTLSRVGGATRVNANSGEDILIGGIGTSFFAAAVLDLTGVAAADRETNYRTALSLMWQHYVLKGRSMLFFDGDSLTDCRTITDTVPGELDPYSEPGWTVQLKSVIKDRYVVRNLAAAGKQFEDQPGKADGNTSPVAAGSKNVLNKFVQLCKYRNRSLTIHAMNALGFNGVYTESQHVANLKLWATDLRGYEGDGVTMGLHWLRTPTSIASLTAKNSAMEAEFDANATEYDYSYFDGMAALSDSTFHNPDPGYNTTRGEKKTAGRFAFWQVDSRIPGAPACQTATVTSDSGGNATVTFTPPSAWSTGVPARVDIFMSTDSAMITSGSFIADSGLNTNYVGRFTASPVVIENLTPSTTYYCVIAPVDRLHQYGPTFDLWAQAYVPLMAPNLGVAVLPTGGMTLAAVAGNAQISLSMDAIAGATHYEWHRKSGATLQAQLLQSPDLHGGTTLLATTTEPTYTDTTVANGTWYHYVCVGRSGTAGNYTYSPISNRASNLPAVVPAIPVNTTPPEVTGGTSVGSVLTTTKGKYSGTYIPFEWVYQWTRDNVAISGQTSSTYTTQVDDLGTSIRCEVRAKNAIGFSLVATSNAIVPTSEVARRNFIGANESGADLATYTFAAEPIGTARADRQVLVFVHARRASATDITATATIGGVAATMVQQIANPATGASSYLGMFLANVPTGTTADIEIEFNSGVIRCGIEVYTMTALTSTTPIDTHSSIAPLSGTINVNNDSVVFAAANRGTNSSLSDWTGLTEDHTDDAVGGESLMMTSASAEIASAGTQAVSVVIAGGGTSINDTFLLASWA
jgi:hypothetical protein